MAKLQKELLEPVLHPLLSRAIGLAKNEILRCAQDDRGVALIMTGE